MENTEFLVEREHLAKVEDFVTEEIERIGQKDPWAATMDKNVAMNLARMYEKQLKEYTRAKEAPYFARIDFSVEGEEREKYYIGRTSILDDENIDDDEIRVVDWRTPVASLYYDGNIGKESYTAPEGIINGELHLKRQYKIANGELLHFSDVTIATNDELLQSSLSESSDARLKNIVATIQAEQNNVIRRDLHKDVIVQGVAGSGKTTVALHRVAYLLYAYKNQLSPEKVLILAPNRFFLDYISDTLPDLGVDDIVQKTYEDFVTDLLNGEITMISQNENLRNHSICNSLLNYRCSMAFKTVVSNYLDDLEKTLVSQITDFVYDGKTLVKAESIKEVFLRLRESLSLAERQENVKFYLTNVLTSILQEYKNGIQALPIDYDSLSKNYKRLITSYMKAIAFDDVMKQYKTLVSNEKYFTEGITKVEYKALKEDVLANLRKKALRYEDLPAILMLYAKTVGIKKDNQPQCVVIDEAQDLGEFHLAVFKEIFKGVHMTILGDIAQGIYARGIEDWQKINSTIFNGEAEIVQLVQSYRTSIEVMTLANKVATKMQEKLAIQLATPVLRHGDEVVHHATTNLDEITKCISDLLAKGRKNIALITKTNGRASKLYESLSQRMSDIHLIDDDTNKFEAGISVLPSYLSKGLEFDSVLLLDEKEYDLENILDAKLLYVSITRAMHSLDVFE